MSYDPLYPYVDPLEKCCHVCGEPIPDVPWVLGYRETPFICVECEQRQEWMDDQPYDAPNVAKEIKAS